MHWLNPRRCRGFSQCITFSQRQRIVHSLENDFGMKLKHVADRNNYHMDPAAAMDVQMMSRMRAVREAEAKGDSEIQKLYSGSVVFITGGTGFLGKQLMEKLLRACHGIKKVYLLTRSKKGKTMEERLTKTFNDPVFNQLRKVNPQFVKLIVPVEGDIMELKLGINLETWEKLTREVNFIFHVAATVLFNEPIKTATLVNVRGTREVIALARECHNLSSMVHVSTAYSHCNRQEVAEKFYTSPVPPATMIAMAESMEEKRLDAMTPALTESWHNTYTFSKAIAEDVVRVMGEGLPICVVRPAIVIASHREPEPGWLDTSNVLGPSGIFLGMYVGVNRTMLLDTDCFADLVPVDYVNNLIIASSWETARKLERGDKEIKIYTCSRIRNRLGLGQCIKIMRNECRNFISPKTIWYPHATPTKHRQVFLILSTILHFIPALCVDGALIAMGKKFRATEMYQKLYKLNTVLGYFGLHTWDFHDDNTLDLNNKLSEADRLIFHCDLADIEHVPFMIVWVLGIRKYIIKDGLKGTEKTLKRQPYMRAVHYILSALYFFSLWKVLSRMFTAGIFCATNILKLMKVALKLTK